MGKSLCLVIDPGHYPGYNPGCIPGYYEGDQMFKLATFEKEYCDANYSDNVDCFLTRKQTEDLSLEAGRGNQAVVKKRSGLYGKVIFMSDHTNAPGGSSANYANIHGVCIYTSLYRTNTDDLTLGLGRKVGELIGGGFNYYDRQILKATDRSDWWGVVRGAMNHARNQQEADTNGAADVAFIIEHGFHTNPTECAWMFDDNNKRKLAALKIDYICAYYGIQKNTGHVEPTPTTIVRAETVNGTLTVKYDGPEGVFAHVTPAYIDSNVPYSLHKDEKRRVVNKVTLNTGETMYQLEDGNYITTHAKYVACTSNLQKGFKQFVGAATAPLDVKQSAFWGSPTVFKLTTGNLFDVIEEAYNGEGHWYMVYINNGQIELNGYVHSDVVKQS